MYRLLISFALVFVFALPCHAIVITLFVDTPTYVERSRDIVIAKCVRPDLGQGPYIDGLHPAEVEVLIVLKGGKAPGKMRIATTFGLQAGKTYLLACGAGGFADNTDFLAIAERSVVEVPANFRLGSLKGKKITEQVQAIFTAAKLPRSSVLAKYLEERMRIPVMKVPPDGGSFVPLLEAVIQLDKERVARAARKVQQSKGPAEMREALRELEEAVKALKARLAIWERRLPSVPKKP
jgi:hypothetical protein